MSRNPLHNMQAEQSVLGAVMLDGEAFEKAVAIVGPDDFAHAGHRLLWRTMTELAAKNSPLDAVTITEHLEAAGRAQDVGGLAYLVTIAKETPYAVNVESYARIVRELAMFRKLAALGGQITELAQNPERREFREVVGMAESLVYALGDGAGAAGQGWQKYEAALLTAIDRVTRAHELGSHITGLPSGFPDLDELTTGFQPADLVILAGRPSMGKSTLAMAMAEHAAKNVPVAVFSLEMPADQLAIRGVSSHGRIDGRALRSGKIEDEHWPVMHGTISKLRALRIFIDDTAGLTVSELRSRCRRLVKEQGQLGMIVVDYLQMLRPETRAASREQEVSGISRALKGIAKEFACPVIALSQLNRSLEQRTNKRPVPSDLRDSGALEQDADLILFVYRDEVYNPESPDKGIAEIIIGKQRNGPLSTVKLQFEGQYTRFGNLASASIADAADDMPYWRDHQGGSYGYSAGF